MKRNVTKILTIPYSCNFDEMDVENILDLKHEIKNLFCNYNISVVAEHIRDEEDSQQQLNSAYAEPNDPPKIPEGLLRSIKWV